MAELNQFIQDNQVVTIALGLPLVAALIALIGHWLTHRSKLAEIRLNGRIRLADLRQANYEELVFGLAETNSIASLQAMHTMLLGTDEEGQKLSESALNKRLHSMLSASEKVILRTSVDAQLRDDFIRSISSCIDLFKTPVKDESVSFEKQIESETPPILKLRKASLKILRAEWDQIEKELKSPK